MLRLRHGYSESRLIAQSQLATGSRVRPRLARLSIGRATLVSHEWGRSIAFGHTCFMPLDLYIYA